MIKAFMQVKSCFKKLLINGKNMVILGNLACFWYRPFDDETRNGLIGKYAHGLSVHVIGGISRRGATRIAVFKQKCNSLNFQELLRFFLIPFINRYYPDYHRVYMDNAPCHTSQSSRTFIRNNGINKVLSPAQSPDFNPIELVWHDMKVYIEEKVKPQTDNKIN